LVAAFVGPYRSTCYFAALCHLRSRSAQSISDSHCIRYDSSHRYRRLSRHIGLEWLRQSNPRRRSLGSNRGNTKDRQKRSALARSQISLGERRAPHRRCLVERASFEFWVLSFGFWVFAGKPTAKSKSHPPKSPFDQNQALSHLRPTQNPKLKTQNLLVPAGN